MWRERNCASSETMDGQIWLLESITHAFLMARASPIRWGRKKKPKKRLAKRWEIKSETIIIIHSEMFIDL